MKILLCVSGAAAVNYCLFISKNKSCCCECLAPPLAGYPLFDRSQFKRQCDARDTQQGGGDTGKGGPDSEPKGRPCGFAIFSISLSAPFSLPRPLTMGATRFVYQQIQSDLNGRFNRHGLNEVGGCGSVDDGMDD